MTFTLVRSLPLSEDSKTAWREAGGIFPMRSRSHSEIIQLAENSQSDFILNLGSSSFTMLDSPLPVWNQGCDIKKLLWPGDTRRLFDDIMPSRPTSFPTPGWIKAPGYGGRGKHFLHLDGPLVLPEQWDWQEHVEGTEYRVITVGPRIVQQLKRSGDNSNRRYEWLPADSLPRGVRPFVKSAASRTVGRNVLAWDVIVSTIGEVKLFEANSCPGMSVPTATRIVNEIVRQQGEMNAQ